ncbi:MAG: nucleotidyltransferase family protein [Dehalococcoidia bacterium]|nr:nucleotidyltransferase family protein [Dehalococcoidia bacterium]
MVYRNLSGHSLSPEDLGTVRGLYRQTWSRNRLAFRAAGDALEVFRASGIPALVLKGAALAHIAYEEQALRPMNDIDILVHGRQLRQTVAALEPLGWRQVAPLRNPWKAARIFHAILLRHPSGVEIDLHRHMLEEACWKGADDALWDDSIEFELDGRPARTIRPEAHLVHVVAHGVRWDPVPPVRWITDSTVLLRRFGAGWDWAFTAELARRLGVSRAVAAGLCYLRDNLGAAVPAEAVEGLLESPSSALERLDFRAQQAGSGPVLQSLRYTTRYLRLSSRRPLTRRIADFPPYLQVMWELDSQWAVPGDAIRRVWLRARGISPG